MLPMFLLQMVAHAEPPPMVPIETVVADSELVMVGTAQRVFFEALKPGESLTRNSHDDYWVEYRVDEVLFGEAPVKVGETLRIAVDPGACEKYDSTFKRTDAGFFEDDRPIEPQGWMPSGPQILLLDVEGGRVRQSQDAFWVSPKPADAEARRAMRALLGKSKKRR
jgi:hypothetical protein